MSFNSGIKSLSTNEMKIDAKYHYFKSLGSMEGKKLGIIIKITDLELWNKLNIETKSVIKIDKSLWILTVNILFENIETILNLSYVLSVDLGSPIYIV